MQNTRIFISLATFVAAMIFGATSAMADLVTERISRNDLRKIANEMSLKQARAEFSNHTFRANRARLGNMFYYLQPNGRAYLIAVGLKRPIPGAWRMKREAGKNFMCVQFPGFVLITPNRSGPVDTEKLGGPGCLPVNLIGSGKDPLSGPLKEKAKGDIFNMRSGKWPFKQVGRSGSLKQLYTKFKSR